MRTLLEIEYTFMRQSATVGKIVAVPTVLPFLNNMSYPTHRTGFILLSGILLLTNTAKKTSVSSAYSLVLGWLC